MLFDTHLSHHASYKYVTAFTVNVGGSSNRQCQQGGWPPKEAHSAQW